MSVTPHAHTLGAIPTAVSGHACIEFANSLFADHTGAGAMYDRLPLAEWRTWFVAQAGLPAMPTPSAATYRELRELRGFIRSLLERVDEPNAQAMTRLNGYLQRSSYRWALHRDSTGFHLTPEATRVGWAAVMSAVAASYGELLASDRLRNVRVCANPDCTYIFLDTSRNASRRWCDVAICGNLMKVREHRRRHGDNNSAEPPDRRSPRF